MARRVLDLGSGIVGAGWAAGKAGAAGSLISAGSPSAPSAAGSPSAASPAVADLALCVCQAIHVPDLRHSHDAEDLYARDLAAFRELAAMRAATHEQVRDARDIDRILAAGKVATMLTLDNALPIGHRVRAIPRLVGDGVKMVTLTSDGHNPIASGCDEPLEGFSTFGREAVSAFEDARIALDVSHLNDTSLYDFFDVAERPFAASHSNARALSGFPRDLTDAEFCAIRDAGGVVGLSPAARHERTELTFDELLTHIDHFLALGGDRVLALSLGLGTIDAPSWLEGPADLADFCDRLACRYGADLADRILFANARDFFVRNETC